MKYDDFLKKNTDLRHYIREQEKKNKVKEGKKFVKIEKVSFENDICLLSNGEKKKIEDIVKVVIEGKDCISNPSILIMWKGFISQKFVTRVKNWWHYYSESGKSTIGKVLREEYGDTMDGAYDGLIKRGYDGLIVKNTYVGLFNQPKVFVPNEVIAFYPNQIKATTNYFPTCSNSIYEKENQKSNVDLINGYSQQQLTYFKNSKIVSNGRLVPYYHSTDEEFDAFDPSFIGESHGASFGPGFYFSSVPLLEYGKPMECYLNITKPYIIYDLDNFDGIVEFLWYCCN